MQAEVCSAEQSAQARCLRHNFDAAVQRQRRPDSGWREPPAFLIYEAGSKRGHRHQQRAPGLKHTVNLRSSLVRLPEVFKDLGGDCNIERIRGKRQSLAAANHIHRSDLKDVTGKIPPDALGKQWPVRLIASANIKDR